MHDLRSASVNNTRMSCAAAAHRLHTFLRYISAQLFGDIVRFMNGLSAAVRRNKEAMLEADFANVRMQPLGPDQEVSAVCAWVLTSLMQWPWASMGWGWGSWRCRMLRLALDAALCQVFPRPAIMAHHHLVSAACCSIPASCNAWALSGE